MIYGKQIKFTYGYTPENWAYFLVGVVLACVFMSFAAKKLIGNKKGGKENTVS